MPLIPFAEHELIPPGDNDPRITARMGILHVDAGNAYDLHDYFDGPSGGIESHGHIAKDGHLFQYRDTGFQADANFQANSFALSFETQGYGEGEWTDEQIATIKRLMLWARDKHRIPLRVVTRWDDPLGGWGYHTLFGAPSMWTPVSKTCPGPGRINQFYAVLVPWMKTNPTDLEDPVTPDDIEKVAQRAAALVIAKLPALVVEQLLEADLFPKRDWITQSVAEALKGVEPTVTPKDKP